MTSNTCFIKITFENIDYIVIPAHYFGDFELSDIRTSVRRAAANAILKYSTANVVVFELKSEAALDASSFEGMVYYDDPYRDTLFDRIMRNDITQIKLIYEDHSEENFFVPWEGTDCSDVTNSLQATSIDSSGTLRVQISAKQN